MHNPTKGNTATYGALTDCFETHHEAAICGTLTMVFMVDSTQSPRHHGWHLNHSGRGREAPSLQMR